MMTMSCIIDVRQIDNGVVVQSPCGMLDAAYEILYHQQLEGLAGNVISRV